VYEQSICEIFINHHSREQNVKGDITTERYS